jgi:tetratricopeptide (TPR) repeat protein
MHMTRYFFLLLFFACFSCRQQAARQTPDSRDSVLHSPLLLPLTDSIRQFPDNAALYFRRGLLLFNTDPQLAQADFEQAARIQPSVTDYWAGAGEAALVNERYRQADSSFTEALKTHPNDPYLQYKLAMAKVESRQHNSAESLAARLEKHPDAFAQAFYLRARMAEDNGDTTLAIAHLKKAVDAAGLQSEYEAVTELTGLLRARRSPDALPYYELAFRIDSSNADPLFEKGQYLEELGKTREATLTYKRCVLADPGYSNAYLALGKLAVESAQWKTAMGHFNLAARAKPNNAEAYYYRGLCHEKLGDKMAAQDDFARALSFRKDYSEAKAALERISN